MFVLIYLLVQYVVVALLLLIVLAMTLRMIFNYADPNPFGSLGKFADWLKKKTNSFVRPIESWLSMGRFDIRLAPFLTIFVACVIGYFTLRLVSTVTTTLDGIVISLGAGRIVAFIGYLLYGLLALLSLAIFVRIMLSWVDFYGNPLTRFLARITDPILLPFRRMIPPLGGRFDVSPIIVLLLLSFLQEAVAGTLIASGR